MRVTSCNAMLTLSLTLVERHLRVGLVGIEETVVALATLALCVATKEEGKRPARNPGLLHLAHAGQSVGSYVGLEGDHGGARAAGGAAGGAGPQILIYGGHPQVTTRVVSKDSLEELDEDIRQHYQQQAPRYVPNSSFRGPYFDGGRQNLGYSGVKDTPQYTPGHDYTAATVAPAYSYPRTYGHFGGAPLLYSPQAHAPLGHFPGLSTFVGQQVHQGQGLQHTPTSSPYSHTQSNTVTPATANYATPTAHSRPTANPLSHPLSSPLLLPAGLPLQHPLQGGLPFHQGLRYQSPYSQGPVFLPVQAFGHQPLLFRNNGQYAETSGRSQYKDEQNDGENYYGGSQGRRPTEYRAREYDDESPAYSKDNNYKSYGKYESDESLPKSAATPSYQTYPSEDQGSYEDSSKEVGSAEKGGFKYSYADEKARAAPVDGEGKFATSYQSVTFETHHPVPRHYPKKPH
ncbi:uncharacterized protein LOC128985206 [Macrosteles quadrilineatus]|uniref:uncharacterized protein LOC128985206 n=1 Tax=Macrosteles quadrilineatus TaxID=74068 RepID=UPI0023E239E0|nr:uncharacterized protein LOC128985206 [Macrosteles quadrilineatus]